MDTLTRFIIYISKKAILFAIIAATLISAGFIGYDCANMYAVVHDGMNARTAVVLDKQDPYLKMSSFFTSDYIANDELLKSNELDEVEVTNYIYHSSIESLWAWPWKDTATVKIKEKMIEMNAQPVKKLAEGESFEFTYRWENGIKELSMVKIDGSWRINDMSVITLDPISAERQ